MTAKHLLISGDCEEEIYQTVNENNFPVVLMLDDPCRRFGASFPDVCLVKFLTASHALPRISLGIIIIKRVNL